MSCWGEIKFAPTIFIFIHSKLEKNLNDEVQNQIHHVKSCDKKMIFEIALFFEFCLHL